MGIMDFTDWYGCNDCNSLDCKEGHMKKNSLSVRPCVCIGVKRTSILVTQNSWLLMVET